MPTILSRVRPYNFLPRNGKAQAQVISRVFHSSVAPEAEDGASIQDYLQSFLPVSPQTVESAGRQFIQQVVSGNQPDIEGIVKTCGGFEPRLLLTLFFKAMSGALRDLAVGGDGLGLGHVSVQAQDALHQFRMAELGAQCMAALHQCHSHIIAYNQGMAAALELLAADISLVVKKFKGGVIL